MHPLPPPLKTHCSAGEGIYDFQLCKATNFCTVYKYLPKKNILVGLSLFCLYIQVNYFLKGGFSETNFGKDKYPERATPLISVFFFSVGTRSAGRGILNRQPSQQLAQNYSLACSKSMGC